MPITSRKLNRPIRKAASAALRGTTRRPLRKARGEFSKDLEEFAGMFRNLGDTAQGVAEQLVKLDGNLEAGDAEAVLSRIDVLDEEVAYDIREAVKTILDDEGDGGIGDLFNRIRDSLDATDTGQEDYEAAAKPGLKKRTLRPGQRRPLRKGYTDSVLAGYMEAALWSTMDESDENTGGEPLDENYDVSDITPETKAEMRKDCEAFIEKASDLLDKASEQRPDYIGHNFWLSRNGHGAGFFDSPDKWGGDDNADALQEMARSFGEYNLSVDEDGGISGFSG